MPQYRPPVQSVVVGFQCVDKVLAVFVANVLDPKVIDGKGEGGGPCFVFP
jgi:hypothetical protein